MTNLTANKSPIKNGLWISFQRLKATEANKSLKTDAKTILYRTILRVVQMPHYGNGVCRSLGAMAFVFVFGGNNFLPYQLLLEQKKTTHVAITLCCYQYIQNHFGKKVNLTGTVLVGGLNPNYIHLTYVIHQFHKFYDVKFKFVINFEEHQHLCTNGVYNASCLLC